MGRFKDNILKDKKFLREMAIILIIGIIINAACFLMPLVVHAENSVQRFPYDYSWNYYPLSESDINTMLTNASAYVDISDPNLIIFWQEIGDNTWLYTYCVAIVDSVTLPSNSTYDSVNLVTDSITFHFSSSYIGLTNLGSFWENANQDYAPTQAVLFGSSASLVHPIDYPYDYTFSLMPFYGNVSLDGKTYIGSNNISVGDFTDLPGIDEILNNIQNTWEPPSTVTGHALPSQPTEDPNNNDFQNRLQMFDYLKDSFNSIVGNLGYNLKKWIDNLTGKIIEGFNSVSQNIWNGFKTLMDNIKDFFGAKIDAIIDKFNYITEPLDQEALNDFIESSSVYGDISSINTSVTTFGSSFTAVSEPDDYTITFHIEDIDILNQSNPFVLHLNILNPIKSTLRAFLWVIVSYGLFISVIDSLPNYINGGGGEDD